MIVLRTAGDDVPEHWRKELRDQRRKVRSGCGDREETPEAIR
jgi:hypothetical protein